MQKNKKILLLFISNGKTFFYLNYILLPKPKKKKDLV